MAINLEITFLTTTVSTARSTVGEAMKRILILPLTLLSFTFPGPSHSVAQDSDRPPECAQWDKIKIPPADLPTEQDRVALAGCYSEDLYFGFGQPADPVQARKCAYLERAAGNDLVFGGSAMLMMIYANGKGAARNFDLALKFACEINDPLITNPSRIDHLLTLRDEHWTGNDFSLCDDGGTSFLVGACTGLDEKFHQVERTRKLDRMVERWSPAEKAALVELQKAASDLIKASSDNEVDTTGTGRASFVFGWQTWLGDGFVAALERCEQGKFPSFSAAEFKKADDELNAAYSDIQSAKPQEAEMGTVTLEGVKTAERAWLKYREAWVNFGLVKYPSVKPESWRTWLTYDRILMLHYVPGPGTPEWTAFQEYRPWRYQYELGNYREAIRLKPDWAPPHDALGGDLATKGDWDGAMKEYREAIRLDPNYADAHHHLGLAFDKRKDWDGAAKEYREVVRLKPDDAGAHYSLGDAFENKKDWDGAVKEFTEAVRLSPTWAPAHGHLAWALVNKKDWDGAILQYREVLRLQPDAAYAHGGIGGALEAKGDWDGAIKEYGEEIRLKPDDAGAHYSLGDAFENKKDWDGAVREFKEAARLNPQDRWAHGRLGWALENKGDRDGAIMAYREAIRLKPDWAEARSDLGYQLYEKGDLDAAIAECREAIRLKPDYAQAHLNLGVALDKKGDWDGAIQEYREAFRLEPDPGELHYYVGQALEHKGDKQAALDEYRQASEADPKNSDYRAAYDKLRKELK
jgi:tetratricopeptide (TPR) repeat protein